MTLLVIVLVAVSLSMDAFSLSLVYGTLGMRRRDEFLLALITGIFHFVMPLAGLCVGSIILKFIRINPDIIVFIILSFIGVEMIISSFKDESKVKLMKFSDFFLFALAVSIDSFSVGITFSNNDNFILGSLVFAVCSFIFTLIGLFLGGKIEKLFGKISTIIGGVILVIIGVCYIV